MSHDIVPRSPANQKNWLENLKTRSTADGPGLGHTAAQVTTETGLIDTLLAPINDAIAKETAAIEAKGLARATMANNNDPLRTIINNYKASTGWNNGTGNAWQVNSSSTQYDMDTHSPTINVVNVGGQTVIRGKKPGFTSASLKMRVVGTNTWLTIATKVAHFPVIDDTAPQTPGKPEEREYQAIGYVGDQEMGQPSPIVRGIYNG
jgi:hypothetical protein